MKMRINKFCIIISLLLSCNQIQTGNNLSKADIQFIQRIKLLDKDEKIYKFYSEFKKQNAGNFFTNKRIAKYWIDERSREKNQVIFAFYKDIKAIDTVYNAGTTYSPYLLVTKSDSTQFKVSVNGTKEEIKSFFEDAFKIWQQKK